MKTIKFFLTTIAVLLGSVMAHAYDFEVGGIYYNIISATDLTAEVTNGDNKYTGDVIIPSTVNYKSRDLSVIAIGWGGFSGCTELNSITIPNSVKSIGGSAFEDCSSLISITIPDSVTSINSSTFEDCSSLTSIIIPNSVITIGWEAFSGCSSLTNITIPNSVISIEKGAFNKCTSLKELRIEDGDTSLEMGYSFHDSKKDYYDDDRYNYYHYGLFSDCPLEILYIGRNLDYKAAESHNSDYYYYYYSPFYDKNLKSVTIGNLVTTIREELFNGCSVKKITIPKNVISIGNRAFDGCSLKELCIEDGGAALELGHGEQEWYRNNAFGYYGLFNYCYLDSLYIGRNLTYKLKEYGSIDYYYHAPFYKNYRLKSVTIGDSVTAIGEELFYNCEKLTYAIIGNNVTEIGMDAFYSCDSLRSITIPSSVVEIGKSAFAYCDSLKYVNIKDSKKTLSTGEGIFDDCLFRGVYLGRNLNNSGSVFSNTDTLTIGSDVTIIGKNTLRHGANISIYSMCTNPPVIESGNDFTESQYVNTTVFIPKGSLNAYQTADVWKNFWDIQEYCLDKKFCVNYYIDEELYAVDSVKHGDTIIPRVEPQKENHEFSGWSYIPKTMPAEDVMVTGTFTANTYTITYMVDEEIFAIDTIAYGDTIVPIAEPTKEGYTFSGWSEVPETMPAEDIIVTGTFTVNTYTITYMIDDEIFATDSIIYGDIIIPIAEPSEEGYTFSGWSEVPEIMPAEDIIVTGTFTVNTYTITYIVDEEFFATDNITYGDTITPIEEPTKEGYTFSGWSEVPETMPAEDIVIDGYFSVNYYALKYTVDNEPFATDSLAYGTIIELRETPKRDDYEFIGWSEAPETMPAHDIEVYGNFIFTSVTDVQVDPEQSKKVIEDNQLFIILPNGKKYNAMGQEIGN